MLQFISYIFQTADKNVDDQTALMLRPKVIILFFTQMRMKLTLLINVKIPTTFGILTFINMIRI